MNRFLVRTMVVAAATAVCLIGSDTWLSRLTAPLQAQQSGDRMPGPIIEDPAGPTGNPPSYVPARSKTTGQDRALSTWEVTYTGFTPQAQVAFQAAVDVWANLVSSTVPIKVAANWVALSPGVLGSAGPVTISRDFAGAPMAGTWYAAATANKIAGSDLVPASNDITANFSSAFPNWYYGTDGQAGSNYDLMTVVMHELGHGLGFLGSMTVSGGSGSWGFGTGFPIIYDRFAVNGASQFLLNTALFPNPSAALGAQLTSNNIFTDGANAKAANGGVRPKLYAPATFAGGSTYSHLDEATYPAGTINSLMTPQLGTGEAIHDPGPITKGLFTDSGWGTIGAVPPPPIVATSAATSITQTGATLNGTVNPNGNSTTGAFHYGLTTGYGSTVTATPAPGSGTSPVAVSAAIAGLNCGTLYHFRVAGTNPGGTTNGGDLTFTTSACPVLTQVAPTFGGQGQANLNVAITGAFTHFVQGTTTASLGAGITVNSTTVTDATHATANVTIAAGAALGSRTVSVTTGGEVASLVSGFTVIVVDPALTGVSPSAGRRGGAATLLVTLTAVSTHFVQGTSVANFGAGVTVNSTTVQSATQAGVSITIPAAAALGARTVTVTTGGEVVALPGGFVVTPFSMTRGDFDGDSRSDIAVFRPSTGVWYVRGVSTTTWGGGADIPVVGDYDGDGKVDVAIFRPSTGVWFILLSGSATGSVTLWGGVGDIPAPGDYDGDGRTDVAVFRPSTGVWYVLYSGTGIGSVTTWGGGGDIPVARDYDGDGRTDVAVFRPSTGVWYILRSSTGVGSVATWGGVGDVPVAADYDGDNKADVAVFRPSTGLWYILTSSTGGGAVFSWGGPGDIPVPAEYDGDGLTDIAVYRPSSGLWYIVTSSTGGAVVISWGGGADIPIVRP